MKTRWIPISIIVATAGALSVVAWLNTGSPSAPAGEGATSREFRGAAATLELKTSQVGVSQTAAAISEQAQSLLENELTAEAASSLAVAFESRVTGLLAPHPEDWASRVSAVAPPPVWLDDQHERHEEMTRRWQEAADTLASAACSAEGMFVRPIDPGREFPELEPGSIVISNDQSSGGLEYPRPAVKNAVAIELLFPIEYRDIRGQTIPATLGLSFWSDQSGVDWTPLDLFIYFGQEAFGRELLAPPY